MMLSHLSSHQLLQILMMSQAEHLKLSGVHEHLFDIVFDSV